MAFIYKRAPVHGGGWGKRPEVDTVYTCVEILEVLAMFSSLRLPSEAGLMGHKLLAFSVLTIVYRNTTV